MCKQGWYGVSCEFQDPCPIVSLDTTKEDSLSPLMIAEWSGFQGYDHFGFTQIADNAIGKMNFQVYERPVYIKSYPSYTFFYVMMFTGRRWIITDSSTFNDDVLDVDYDASNIEHIKEFLSSRFHAYWSNFKPLYISDPVDMNTPTDAVTPVGLNWYVALKGKNTGIYMGEIIDVSFHCAFCNEATSSCQNQGIFKMISLFDEVKGYDALLWGGII